MLGAVPVAMVSWFCICFLHHSAIYFDTVSPSVLQAKQEISVILLMFALHICVSLCNSITDFQVFVITPACSPTVLYMAYCMY